MTAPPDDWQASSLRLRALAREMWETDRKGPKVILDVLRHEPEAEIVTEDHLLSIVHPYAVRELRLAASDQASSN